MEKTEITSETMAYIDAHLKETLSLEVIANEIGYSKFHLLRKFSEQAGCTIYKYIQKRRLEEAAKQLAETNQSIIEIALDSNYNSQQAFTLAFKQIYDCTPQVYRERQNHKNLRIKCRSRKPDYTRTMIRDPMKGRLAA